MFLPSHPTTAKMAKLGPNVAQETKPNANSSFPICVIRSKNLRIRRGETRSSYGGRGGVPRTGSPLPKTSTEKGKDSKLKFCGQYNKLKLSQNKYPSPSEDEGVLGNQTPRTS